MLKMSDYMVYELYLSKSVTKNIYKQKEKMQSSKAVGNELEGEL